MIDCNNVKKITDITDQIEYTDKKAGGKSDSQKVSCGQDNGYNELQDKYDKYFKDVPGIPEELIANIMCKCCKVHISELPDSDAGVVPDTFAMRFSRV